MVDVLLLIRGILDEVLMTILMSFTYVAVTIVGIAFTDGISDDSNIDIDRHSCGDIRNDVDRRTFDNRMKAASESTGGMT